MLSTTRTTVLLAMSTLGAFAPVAALAQPANVAEIDDRDNNTQVNYASVYQNQEAANNATADNTQGLILADAIGNNSDNTAVAANAAVAFSIQSQSSEVNQANFLSDDDINTIVQIIAEEEEE